MHCALFRELATSKGNASSRRKSSPSTSSKQLDQRKKLTPSSSVPSVILTKSLSSGAVASVARKASTSKEEANGGQAGEDRSNAQIGVPLISVGEDLMGESVSGQGQVGTAVSEEEQIKVLLGGGHIEGSVSEGRVKDEASGGLVGATLAGGVVKSASCGSQEQVGVVVSSVGLSGFDFVADKMIKLETSPVKVVASASPVIGGKPVTSLPLAPTFSKMLVDVTAIKKEPSNPVMPAPMDVGGNSTSRLLATPPKEEKIWLPMQTPQPSTHGTHVPAEMHVIIQQPNTAAMLMQENLRKASIPIASQPSVVVLPTTSLATGFSSSTTTSSLPSGSNLTVTAVSNSPGLSSFGSAPTSKVTGLSVAGAIVKSVSVSRQPVVIPKEVAMATSLPTDSTLAVAKTSPLIMGRASVTSPALSDLASLTTSTSSVKSSPASVAPPTLPLLPEATTNSSPTTSTVKSLSTTQVLLPSRLSVSLLPVIKPLVIPTLSLGITTPTTSEVATPTASLAISARQSVNVQKTVAHAGRDVSTRNEGVSFAGGSDKEMNSKTAAEGLLLKDTMTRTFSATSTSACASRNASNITAVTSRSKVLSIPTSLNPVSSTASVSIPVSIQASVPVPTLVLAPGPAPTCVSTPGLVPRSVSTSVSIPAPVPVHVAASISAFAPTISSVSPSVQSSVPIPISTTSSAVKPVPVSSFLVQQQQTVVAAGAEGSPNRTCPPETDQVSKEVVKPKHGVAKADFRDTGGTL